MIVGTAVWLWCIVLVVLTILIHVVGITTIARALRVFWYHDVVEKFGLFDSTLGIVGIITTVALLLAMLHGLEIFVWGEAYLRIGAFTVPGAAFLYSIGSMTTRGSSGFRLPMHWSFMGGVEAGDGMLLFGISTAFIFTVMVRLWRSSEPRTGL